VNAGRLRLCRVAALLLIVAARGSGLAAETDPKSQDLTRTARDLSDQGLAAYQRGDFDAAIESFMGAFALSNNPGLIFNVAQAYRLKGDCGHAKEHYRRYLDLVPDSALKSSVDRRIDEMESCLQANVAAANPSRTVAASPSTTPVTPTGGLRAVAAAPALSPRPSPAAPEKHRALTWTLRGSAAALLASAAVFGGLAWDARGDAEDTSLQRPAVEASDRYARDSALAWTFAVSGLACGVISYFVSRRP